MEPFLDGGLLELLFMLGFAAVLNYIFMKRLLLILFSLIILLAPMLLLFINKNELYNWVVSICLVNAVLTVILIWKQKKEKPGQHLFNIETITHKLSAAKNKWKSVFSKRTKQENKEVQNV